MLLSMTGYGKTEIGLPDKKITIEIKSLNSKIIDTNLKIPSIYREKEIHIRKIIQNRIKRGKIDCNIYYELNEGNTSAQINGDVFENYFNQLNQIRKDFKIDDSNIISAILKLPDTVRTEKIILTEEEWNIIQNGLNQAIDQLDLFRKQEGEAIEKDLHLRVENILKLLDSVEPFETARIEKIKERLGKSLEEFNKPDEYDPNRFEQELIFYLEKLDISEEKTRLKNHCEYFHQTMAEETESGKKLSFISQEMGREINTLGSKANDSNVQHIVVKMKDELEKIKEQILNIL